jgi:hypothetical protein
LLPSAPVGTRAIAPGTERRHALSAVVLDQDERMCFNETGAGVPTWLYAGKPQRAGPWAAERQQKLDQADGRKRREPTPAPTTDQRGARRGPTIRPSTQLGGRRVVGLSVSDPDQLGRGGEWRPPTGRASPRSGHLGGWISPNLVQNPRFHAAALLSLLSFRASFSSRSTRR